LPRLIEYYMSLMPGRRPPGLADRLFLVSVGDSSARPLVEKILAHPHLIEALRPDDQATSPEKFVAEFGSRGGIVEERIEGEAFQSPSVQLRASPLRDVEVLSIHDQILGGATGQEFLGCRFPDREYGWLIAGLASRASGLCEPHSR
jgi:hypothetical protein